MDCAGCPDRENLKDRELVFTPDDQQRAARLWLMVFTGKYYEGVDMGRTGIVDPGGAHKGRFQENMPRIGWRTENQCPLRAIFMGYSVGYHQMALFRRYQQFLKRETFLSERWKTWKTVPSTIFLKVPAFTCEMWGIVWGTDFLGKKKGVAELP
jgi:hypothetical protein